MAPQEWAEGSSEVFGFDFLTLHSSGKKKLKKICSGSKGNSACGWHKAGSPPQAAL